MDIYKINRPVHDSTNKAIPLSKIAKAYHISDQEISLKKVEGGHINESFKWESGLQKDDIFFLQKVNTKVFTNLSEMQWNYDRIFNHSAFQEFRKSHCPILVRTKDEKAFFRDEDGSVFRMFHWLGESINKDELVKEEIIYKIAKTMAFFHDSIDEEMDNLKDIIPHFHALDIRFFSLESSLKLAKKNRISRALTVLHSFRETYDYLRPLTIALKNKNIPIRAAHNDTKLSNFFLQKHSKTVFLTDFDTLQNGSILTDFADCTRSFLSPLNEDEIISKSIDFNWNLLSAFSEGYFSHKSSRLTQSEIDLLPYAIIYMPFIMAVRFLTDFLQNDIYFHTQHPEQNWDRAINQWTITQELLRTDIKSRLWLKSV